MESNTIPQELVSALEKLERAKDRAKRFPMNKMLADALVKTVLWFAKQAINVADARKDTNPAEAFLLTDLVVQQLEEYGGAQLQDSIVASLTHCVEFLKRMRCHDKAIDYCQRALRLCGEKGKCFALLNFKMGTVYFHAGKFEEASQWYEQARKAQWDDVKTKYLCLNNLCVAYMRLGYTDRAEEVIRESETFLTMPEDHVAYLGNWAVILQDCERNDEAADKLQLALALVCNGSEMHGRILNNLAAVKLCQGKLQEVEPLLQEAETIVKKAVGTQHTLYGMILLNKMTMLNRLCDTRGARKAFRAAYRVYENAMDSGCAKDKLGVALCEIGDLEFCEDNWTEAKLHFSRATVIFREFGSEERAVVASLHAACADAMSSGSFDQQALRRLKSAVNDVMLLHPKRKNISSHVYSLCQGARTLAKFGAWKDALYVAQEACDISIQDSIVNANCKTTLAAINAGMSLWDEAGRLFRGAEVVFSRLSDIESAPFFLERGLVIAKYSPAIALSDLRRAMSAYGDKANGSVFEKAAMLIKQLESQPNAADCVIA